MTSRIGQIITIQPTNKIYNGLVVFLHGSGDTGQGIRHWARTLLQKEFSFPHLKVIFPTAPIRSYTPLNGEFANVWFDRKSISPDVAEDRDTIDQMASAFVQLINKEHAQGIPYNRIIIGGFSMGGAMAMHLGFRFFPQVAGVFTLSSFLNKNSLVYEHIKSAPEAEKPELLMVHGKNDALVRIDWGKNTFETLKKYGTIGTFKTYEEMEHELDLQELNELNEWINKLLPPLASS